MKKLDSTILDSRLIVTTKKENYNLKMVTCGDFIQVYLYNADKIKSTNDYLDDLNLKKCEKKRKLNEVINLEESTDIEDTTNKENFKKVDKKNIIRSKLECQRLAKGNIEEWETFITLTFSDNIIDMNYANKKFRYFIDKIKRVYKDFKYLCVPEFQKRGAVHYHLLTNIKINDKKLMYKQENNSRYSHVKYWNEGFTSVEEIKGDIKKIVGYIAKYMTKDIDNRLFNRHRYFYSRNLNIPIVDYININIQEDIEYYAKKIQDKELIYQNEYLNPLDNSQVTFLEYTNSK